MSEYTPGPWEVRQENATSGLTDTYVTILRGDVYGSDIAEVYDVANAHLIAAAPGLYEALREILEWAEKGGPLYPREHMEQAVAKAEGRE